MIAIPNLRAGASLGRSSALPHLCSSLERRCNLIGAAHPCDLILGSLAPVVEGIESGLSGHPAEEPIGPPQSFLVVVAMRRPHPSLCKYAGRPGRSLLGGRWSASRHLHRPKQNADTSPMERLLSVPEVAALLGVSRAQVYRYVEAGLPCVRLSDRVLRVRPVDLESWIGDLRAQPAEPGVTQVPEHA